MIDTFFPETLPTNTAELIKVLQDKTPTFLQDFYLSGGTALSLQIGHRESEDLDFFSHKAFNPDQLQKSLMTFGNLEQTELADGTLNTFLNGVKLQFLEYPYDLIEPLNVWGKLQLSSIIDIACTKLQTIGMRGSKKDFIDLFFILQTYTLADLFAYLEKKYPQVEYSQTHILKSLVYFEDAQHQPMPRMHKEISWENVKSKMISQVKQYSF